MRWMMAWMVGLMLVLAGDALLLGQEKQASPDDSYGPTYGNPTYGNPAPGNFSLPASASATAERPSDSSQEPSAGRRVRWVGAAAELSQRLGEKVQQQETKVQFIDTPLVEAVGYLKQLHGIEIQIDQRALKDVGLNGDLPITRNMEGITLEAALDKITEAEQLGWYVEHGMLMITSDEAARQRMSVRIYELPTIATAGLEDALLKTVAPESWTKVGGTGNVVLLPEEDLLVVRQNRAGHALVESLLQQLAGLSDSQ